MALCLVEAGLASRYENTHNSLRAQGNRLQRATMCRVLERLNAWSDMRLELQREETGVKASSGGYF